MRLSKMNLTSREGVSRRGREAEAENSLLDLHKSSDDTQPHSIIANYIICLSFEGYLAHHCKFDHFQ